MGRPSRFFPLLSTPSRPPRKEQSHLLENPLGDMFGRAWCIVLHWRSDSTMVLTSRRTPWIPLAVARRSHPHSRGRSFPQWAVRHWCRRSEMESFPTMLLALMGRSVSLGRCMPYSDIWVLVIRWFQIGRSKPAAETSPPWQSLLAKYQIFPIVSPRRTES